MDYQFLSLHLVARTDLHPISAFGEMVSWYLKQEGDDALILCY